LRERGNAHMSQGPRVAVIGLDCGTPQLLFRDLADEIPNIRKLMDNGLHGDLASITPPITVPAWACAMSGKTPGQLGIYGFRNRKDTTYDGLSIATSDKVTEPQVWDELGKGEKILRKRISFARGGPPTQRYLLKGKKRADVAAKDVMLVILSSEYMKTSQGIGKVLEFAGEDLKNWSMDERATLTNMAVEAGGTTGIIEPDDQTLEYVVKNRGLDPEEVRKGFVFSDPDAQYAATFEIDLDEIRPMVALPGDPRNGIPIDELAEEVKIDAAYGGSCTGGKMADMDMYATVLQNALKHGKRVAPGVHLYLQFGSQKFKQYAREKGYIEIFTEAGAELIDPSCGACINAGPGASKTAETVTVSAQNRNFPGRSGPGKLYLASPYVVAASAIAGKIVEPDEFLS